MNANHKEPIITVMGGPTILNLWGKTNLLLQLLKYNMMLPDAHIYYDENKETYCINGIAVGNSEEEVTTCVWLMVDSFKSEGHIDFRDNATISERESESMEA